MPFNRVKEYVKSFDQRLDPIAFEEKTNTVEDAARALGVEGAQIAKSILFKSGDRFGLFVTAGDVRVNQKIVKSVLGSGKVKMASADEVEQVTGFRVGGVCPFALNQEVPIYLDESMKRFNTVFTAAGTAQSALPITFEQLQSITNGTVINVQNEEKSSN